MAYELGCEPVKQLGIRRQGSGTSEVIRRGDDPIAEMLLPDSVDEHPGGERMIGTFSKAEALRGLKPAVRGKRTGVEMSLDTARRSARATNALREKGMADFNPRGALAPLVGSKAEALRGLKAAVLGVQRNG